MDRQLLLTGQIVFQRHILPLLKVRAEQEIQTAIETAIIVVILREQRGKQVLS